MSAAKLAVAAVRAQNTKIAATSASLMTNILTPTPLTGKTISSSAAVRSIPALYTLPRGSSMTVTWDWFLYLCACATNKKETSAACWTTWLLSLIWLVYGPVIQDQLDKEFVVTVLSDKSLRVIAGYHTEVVTHIGESVADLGRSLPPLSARYVIAGLPTPGGFKPADYQCPMSTLVMYAYFGIICFSVSKDAGDRGKAALHEGRPKALMEKYKWSASDAPMIGSTLRPSAHVFSILTQCWMRIPSVRSHLFTHLAHLSSLGVAAEDEATYTTVRLMKWNNLTHVALIGLFLNKFPHARYAAMLASEIEAHNRGLQQLGALCPPLMDTLGRPIKNADGSTAFDSTLMPYVKVLYSDKLDIAMQKDMKGLLAVAHAMLRPENDSLKDYTAPTGYDALITAFRAYDAEVRLAAQENDEEDQAAA
jgi:hypothetical protein